MKAVGLVLFILISIYGLLQSQTSIPGSSAKSNTETNSINTNDSNLIITNAYKNKQSDIQVKGFGTVSRLLKDDNKGSRHQRFIVRLSTGQKILITHNIDLAPKIIRLKQGDEVEFYGEYEWNDKGGVVHWTHKDPGKRHIYGWLKHQQQKYD